MAQRRRQIYNGGQAFRTGDRVSRPVCLPTEIAAPTITLPPRHLGEKCLRALDLHQPLALDLQEPGTDVAHETAVVRDQDARCSVFEDFFLQLLPPGNVDMVGGSSIR